MSVVQIETKEAKPDTLEIKRCYLPFIIVATCPTCNLRVERHLDDDYLSYPRLDEAFSVDMTHYIVDEKLEHEWEVNVILRMTLEPA